MTHICVSYLTIIGSDNGLSPGRRQAIIWTNAGILLIEPLATNLASILSRPQCVNSHAVHLVIPEHHEQFYYLHLSILLYSRMLPYK